MRSSLEFVPRSPRYPAKPAQRLPVEIELEDQSVRTTRLCEAFLVDISRQGLCVTSTQSVNPDTPFHATIRLTDGRSWRRSGTVRWCSEEQGYYVWGCSLLEPLPWELLGELLLQGYVVR